MLAARWQDSNVVAWLTKTGPSTQNPLRHVGGVRLRLLLGWLFRLAGSVSPSWRVSRAFVVGVPPFRPNRKSCWAWADEERKTAAPVHGRDLGLIAVSSLPVAKSEACEPRRRFLSLPERTRLPADEPDVQPLRSSRTIPAAGELALPFANSTAGGKRGQPQRKQRAPLRSGTAVAVPSRVDAALVETAPPRRDQRACKTTKGLVTLPF